MEEVHALGPNHQQREKEEEKLACCRERQKIVAAIRQDSWPSFLAGVWTPFLN